MSGQIGVLGYDLGMKRQHQRRSIRLKGWDYRSAGVYFVTICTFRREMLFADESFKQIAENRWEQTPEKPHAAHVVLDEWVVMPNHVHGLLFFREQRPDTRDTPLPDPAGGLQNAPAGSLGVVVGQFKSDVTRQINRVRRSPGRPVWQRGFYERIVRNDRELNAIRKYIRENPVRWAEDRDNLDELLSQMTKRG